MAPDRYMAPYQEYRPERPLGLFTGLLVFSRSKSAILDIVAYRGCNGLFSLESGSQAELVEIN